MFGSNALVEAVSTFSKNFIVAAASSGCEVTMFI
jgi:hypothetical protein